MGKTKETRKMKIPDEVSPSGEFLCRFEDFIVEFNGFCEYVHAWAVSKGFWEKGADRNMGELFALIHSEVSKAFEAYWRHDGSDDKVPNYSALEIEMADVLIRCMDLSAARHMNLGAALVAKMAYNETRPHKHGRDR